MTLIDLPSIVRPLQQYFALPCCSTIVHALSAYLTSSTVNRSLVISSSAWSVKLMASVLARVLISSAIWLRDGSRRERLTMAMVHDNFDFESNFVLFVIVDWILSIDHVPRRAVW